MTSRSIESRIIGMGEDVPTETPPPTPPEEVDYDTWLNSEAVKKLTGQYANRLFVQQLGDGLLRLNFGDVMDANDPSYHTAIVLTAANALSFADLVYRMGLDSQEALAAHAVAAAAAAADAAAAAAEASMNADDGHRS